MQPLTRPAGTDTDGFLEHSPIGGSLYYKGPTLQKKIPGGFFDPPSISFIYTENHNCYVCLNHQI